MSTPGKRTFPRDLVRDVFLDLWQRVDPAQDWQYDGASKPVHCPHARCDRFCATGGYRRGKSEMKDLEILYIPRVGEEADPGDLFGALRSVNLTDRFLEELERQGVITRRLSSAGHETWGALNKLARHVATGLPIDFFAASHENWFNRLVVTTGPKDLNILISGKAREIGWEWEVYQAGFFPRGKTWETAVGERRTMRSEREVFAFAQLPYMRPEERQVVA